MRMHTHTLAVNEQKQIIFTWFGESTADEQHDIILEGDNSEVDVYGVFYGKDNTSYKNTVRVIHKGRNTRANVFACGVAVDKSFIDFSGMLRVEQGAKGTRTFFRANMMILDKQAAAHTFPGLEIEENEILQGGHAATVGKVNEDQMFYLMSRGLDYITARKQVIHGFFETVVCLLPDDEIHAVRSRLESLLE